MTRSQLIAFRLTPEEYAGLAAAARAGRLAPAAWCRRTTLERVKLDRFVARLDDGRRVAFDPRQYDSIAHGYAVTIHKSQGATVDRTYVLADPLMNRNASYVALTRHREGVQVYTDRQTFTDREQLDRSLSRAPSKDLARDYAAAAIERHAARLAPLADQVRSLRGQSQEIAGVARRPSRMSAPRRASSATLAWPWPAQRRGSTPTRPRRSSG